jgi:tetratricopeptide (TPR) repeat protein
MDKNGHDLQAIYQYELARKNDPRLNSKVCRRLALLYDRIGDSQRALVEYKQCLAENPKDPDLLNDIGYCHYQRGEWLEAEKWFRQSLDMAPQHARATVNLGMTLGQQARYDEAFQTFKKVNTEAEAYVNMGFIYQTHGKRDEAKQAYRTALQVQPDLDLARRALAKLEAPPTPKATDDAVLTADAKVPMGRPEAGVPSKPDAFPAAPNFRTEATSLLHGSTDLGIRPTRAEQGPPDLSQAVKNLHEREADLARLEEFVRKRREEVRQGPPDPEPPTYVDPVREKVADAAPMGMEAPKGLKVLRATKPIVIGAPVSSSAPSPRPPSPGLPIAVTFD